MVLSTSLTRIFFGPPPKKSRKPRDQCPHVYERTQRTFSPFLTTTFPRQTQVEHLHDLTSVVEIGFVQGITQHPQWVDGQTEGLFSCLGRLPCRPKLTTYKLSFLFSTSPEITPNTFLGEFVVKRKNYQIDGLSLNDGQCGCHLILRPWRDRLKITQQPSFPHLPWILLLEEKKTSQSLRFA